MSLGGHLLALLSLAAAPVSLEPYDADEPLTCLDDEGQHPTLS